MYDYRSVEIDIHSEPGSVEVRLGGTRSVGRAAVMPWGWLVCDVRCTVRLIYCRVCFA